MTVEHRELVGLLNFVTRRSLLYLEIHAINMPSQGPSRNLKHFYVKYQPMFMQTEHKQNPYFPINQIQIITDYMGYCLHRVALNDEDEIGFYGWKGEGRNWKSSICDVRKGNVVPSPMANNNEGPNNQTGVSGSGELPNQLCLQSTETQYQWEKVVEKIIDA